MRTFFWEWNGRVIINASKTDTSLKTTILWHHSCYKLYSFVFLFVSNDILCQVSFGTIPEESTVSIFMTSYMYIVLDYVKVSKMSCIT
jgi:hypothetical protein